MTIVIANIISFIASIIMIYTGCIKNKNKILIMEGIEVAMYAVANLILGGISGFVVNILGIVRNILQYFGKLKGILKWVILLLTTGLAMYFNNHGIIRSLPVIATGIYIAFLDIQDIIKFKVMVIINLILWVIYDIYLLNISSFIFGLIIITANLIAIIKIEKDRKRQLV